VAAGAERRVARRDQGARGDVGDAVVAVRTGEHDRADAVLDEATPSRRVEGTALEHVGHLESATVVDGDAVVVPVETETHPDGRGHPAAGGDLLVAVEEKERAAAIVVGAAGDHATVEVEVRDTVGETGDGVHGQRAADIQGQGGDVALGFAVAVDAAEDPLVVGVEGGAIVHDHRAGAQFAAGGGQGTAVDRGAAGVGVVARKDEGAGAGLRDRARSGNPIGDRGGTSGDAELGGGVVRQAPVPHAGKAGVFEDEQAGVDREAADLVHAADLHGARARLGGIPPRVIVVVAEFA